MSSKPKSSRDVLPIQQAKPKTELAVTGRLVGAGIPETEIRQAIALMRTGCAVLARVIAGDLEPARVRRGHDEQ